MFLDQRYSTGHEREMLPRIDPDQLETRVVSTLKFWVRDSHHLFTSIIVELPESAETRGVCRWVDTLPKLLVMFRIGTTAGEPTGGLA